MQGFFAEYAVDFRKKPANRGKKRAFTAAARCDTIKKIHGIPKERSAAMVRKLKKRKFVLPAVLILGLLGLLLRLAERKTGSAALLWMLTLLSVLAAVFAVLTARSLKPRPRYAPNNRPSSAMTAELLAALMLLAASVVQLLTLTGAQRWLIGLGGLGGALCLGAFTLRSLSRTAPSPYLYMGFTVSLICRLIPEFRAWSIDPHLSDYCFRLFAMIAVMCASFQLGGFALNQGKRRMTVFFCVAGIFFCVLSLADGNWTSRFSYLAYGIFLAAVLWSVMAPGCRRRPRPEPPTE